MKFPRDNKGRAVKKGPCDICGYGTLQYEGDGVWMCDGLMAENERDDHSPLVECNRHHFDGEALSHSKQ
jgi:hypothetical protein